MSDFTLAKFANNITLHPAAPILVGATSIVVSSSTGVPFLAAGEYFYATIEDTGTATVEIVKVTARTGTTWTVVRAQEGTTAHAYGTSDVNIELRLTAGQMADLQATLAALAAADTSISGSVSTLAADIPEYLKESNSAPTGLGTAKQVLRTNATATALEWGTPAITELSGYDANKYVDHTGVSIATATGLSGGGSIASSRTISLDINALTELTGGGVDTSNDLALVWDYDAAVHKKVKLANLSGAALGDGRWVLATDQSIGGGSEVTLLFATAMHNALTRGAFASNTYTANYACRIAVMVHAHGVLLTAAKDLTLTVLVNGGEVARDYKYNSHASSALDTNVQCSVVLSLAAGDTVVCHIKSSATSTTIKSTAAYTHLSIVEMA